jgi:hypothetical protein
MLYLMRYDDWTRCVRGVRSKRLWEEPGSYRAQEIRGRSRVPKKMRGGKRQSTVAQRNLREESMHRELGGVRICDPAAIPAVSFSTDDWEPEF